MKQSRVTVLYGLPRVGRSVLLADWCEGQVGLQRVKAGDVATCTAPLQVLDHLDVGGAGVFVDAYRNIEAERPTKFVVAPVDLAATRFLQQELTAAAQLVALEPMQRHEWLAEELQAAEPSGPEADFAPVESATNRPTFDPDRHWLRGGFSESFEATSDAASLQKRRDLIEGLMLRDYASWGIAPGPQLIDYLTWVANQNGGELDLAKPPIGKQAEARSALFLLIKLGVLRQLRNYPGGSTASLSLKPKVHFRDSGLLHAVLGIETMPQLRGHRLLGESWEGYAIETLILAAGRPSIAQFYRKEGPEGPDEIDLVLDFRAHNGKLVAIECKVSPNEPPRPGYYRALEAIGATDGFVVHSGGEANLAAGTHRLDLESARMRVLNLSR
ncbi:DUF4143 domain-containing protein [Brevundimonas sp. R86498]|uniref:DUF4143 domain-containing protein n=1 Tax=Brevundimonas sp. R86498 TaxID=3093845 RepID=UPI0037C4FD61